MSNFSRTNSPFGGSLNMKPAQLKPTPSQPFAGVNTSGIGPLQGTPQAAPQPVDPALEQQRLIGNRNVAVSRGEGAYDLGNLGFDYGYNPDGTINTANPYSRAALYQQQYEASKRGTTNSLAAQGQQYSGAFGRAQNRNDRNYAQNEAGNRLAYQRSVHGVQAGQLGTLANAGTGVSDADFAALLRATYPGS